MRSEKRKESDSAPLAPLLAALGDLSRWLKSTQTPGAIIGGIAASILGRPRFTRDIDAVVLRAEEDWPEFLSSGQQFGFHPRRSDAVEFARKARVLLVRHQSSGIDVDVSLGSLPFEKELIDRAVWRKIAGVSTPLPRVEDLIVMKAVAHRRRDLDDIEGLVEANPDLDTARIMRLVSDFAAALEMPGILTDLQAILNRGSANV